MQPAPAQPDSPEAIQAVVNDPLVRRAVELLGAKIVHVEVRKPEPGAAGP